MTTHRTAILKLAPSVGLVLSLGLGACAKGSGPTTEPPTDTAAQPSSGEPASGEPAADPLGGEPVVKNVDAQPGDVTTCPYSGRTFVVKAEHPKVDYNGQSYWLCSEKAAEAVRADPTRYLDGFTG
jgi:YHS domain-containing protein